jgi:rod shape-determining protein MreC
MRRVKAGRRVLVMVGTGAVPVVLGVLGAIGPLRWAYDHTALPMAGWLSGLGEGAGSFFGDLTQVRNLARQNAQLEQQNATLRQQLAADNQTRQDNDVLRKQLGLDVAGAPPEVAAEVVALQPDSYRQFVTINKGSKAGVKPGMAVMSQGVLMGTVASVSSGTAKVMLVTDPEFKLTAEDQATAAQGLIAGQLGGGLVLDDIAQTDTVKPGDTVTTSGLGGVVPAGLLIGQVESVNTRSNAVFQLAAVETSLDPSSLRFAFVVLGPGQ